MFAVPITGSEVLTSLLTRRLTFYLTFSFRGVAVLLLLRLTYIQTICANELASLYLFHPASTLSKPLPSTTSANDTP